MQYEILKPLHHILLGHFSNRLVLLLNETLVLQTCRVYIQASHKAVLAKNITVCIYYILM